MQSTLNIRYLFQKFDTKLKLKILDLVKETQKPIIFVKMISFNSKYLFKSLSEEDKTYEEANILCFQVKNIFQQKLTQDFKPDILKSCKNCKAILIHDFCPICDKKLRSYLPSYLLFEYEIQNNIIQEEKKYPVVVFVIDVSGSMGESNRLENVKIACKNTINKLKETKISEIKIGLITFSDKATYYHGEGSEVIESFNMNNEIRREKLNLKNIKSSCDEMKNKIANLHADGGTNICGALHKAVSIATEIVLCTDGEAQDQNIEFYDKLIQFSRINHIKINIITFNDCNSRISVLGKFSRGTGGFLSITTDAIQLETCMEKLVKSTVNYSQSTKFSLIYDEKEANFANLTHFEQSKVSEISVSDKSEKWLFGVKVRDPNLKEIVYQLKVYDSNKLRVLTEKKEIINSQIRFVERIQEKSVNLFNTMIVTLITNQIIYSNIIDIDIKYYKELYERFGLDASILSELVSSIEILKQKQKLENLNDKEAAPIYDSVYISKESIKFEEKKFDPEYKKKIENLYILMIKYRHEKLSSMIRRTFTKGYYFQESAQSKIISEKVDWSINRIWAYSFDQSNLLLLKELLKIVRFFLPNIRMSKFEPISNKMIKSKLEINRSETSELRNSFNAQNLTSEVINSKSSKTFIKKATSKKFVYEFNKESFKYNSPYTRCKTASYLPSVSKNNKIRYHSVSRHTLNKSNAFSVLKSEKEEKIRQSLEECALY
jgi:hypothetical protein